MEQPEQKPIKDMTNLELTRLLNQNHAQIAQCSFNINLIMDEFERRDNEQADHRDAD